MDNPAGGSEESAAQLAFIRDETRFEIGLLHDRVNALVTAEAFLTIAFTTAMGNTAAWGVTFAAVVAPILSVLGLLLALLAWPGIDTTAKIILSWTTQRIEVTQRDPALAVTAWPRTPSGRGRRTEVDQRRSMLFFRAVPVLFATVWVVLTVVALVLPR